MRGHRKTFVVAAVLVVLALGVALLVRRGDDDDPREVAADRVTLASLRADPCRLVAAVEVADAIARPVVAAPVARSDGPLQQCAYTVDPTGTPPQVTVASTSSTTTTTAPGEVPLETVPGSPSVEPAETEPLVLSLGFRDRAAPGDPRLVLPDGKAVDGLGDEAAYDQAAGPATVELVVRTGGLLLDLRFGPTDDPPDVVRRQVLEVGRLALRSVPDLQATARTAPTTPGDGGKAYDPCDALGDGTAAAEDLDVDVTVTPLYPAGCTVVFGDGGQAVLQVVTGRGKPAAAVEAFAQTSEGKAWRRTEVDLAAGAAWLDDPEEVGRGSLLVASHDVLIGIELRKPGATAAEARELATRLAAAADA